MSYPYQAMSTPETNTVPREQLGMTREEAMRYEKLDANREAVVPRNRRMWVVEWRKVQDQPSETYGVTSGIVLNTVFHSEAEAKRMLCALDSFCALEYSFQVRELEAA